MKEYSNGPIPDEKRTCTDLWCFIILVIFGIVMLCIGIYAWTHGNFSKLTTPYDPDGKGCGVDYPNYPYIYFASPHADSLWVTVCVKSCPHANDTSLNCQVNSVVTSCSPVNSTDNTKAVTIYESSPTAGVLCTPSDSMINAQIAGALGSGSSGGANMVSSLAEGWVLVLIALPIAILLSIIFMLIIRYTAGFFVYLLIFFSVGALVAFGIYLIVATDPTMGSGYASILQNTVAKTIIGAICIALGVAIIVLFCCFRARISLASSIIKVSARFVDGNLGVLALPLILFVVMIIFLTVWILEALGYYSLGTPITAPHQYPFQHFETTWTIKALALIHLFFLFWVMFFLVQTSDFIVAGTATNWYFQTGDQYSHSQYRYRNFHIGSVAMGSFFLALIGFIKFVYELLTPQDATEGSCLAGWKKFCSCLCCLCVTYLFNCFSSGAYVFIHLSGKTYCPSAFQVISLKIKEPVTTAVVMILQILFTVLIRVGITALTCLIIYLLIQNVSSFSSKINDSTVIMIIVGVIGFTISSFFVSVYSEAMEAIYVSYLVEKDTGGSTDKCPEELKEFLANAKAEGQFVQ